MGNNIEAAQALVTYQQQYGDLVHDITEVPPHGPLRRLGYEARRQLRYQMPGFGNTDTQIARIDELSTLVGNVFPNEEESKRVRDGFITDLLRVKSRILFLNPQEDPNIQFAGYVTEVLTHQGMKQFEASNHDEAQVYAAEHNLDAEKVERLFTASHAAGIAIAGLFLGMGRHKPRLEDDFLAVVESVSQARDDAFAI